MQYIELELGKISKLLKYLHGDPKKENEELSKNEWSGVFCAAACSKDDEMCV